MSKHTLGLTTKWAALFSLFAFAAVPLRASADAASDFQTRSSGSGVIRADAFDSAGQVAAHVFPDGNFEKSGSGFDANVKASGGGSLHFVVPAQSGSGGSGAWRVNFADAMNIKMDANTEFYVQWRQRFDTNFVNTKFVGSGGWKQIILGEADVAGQPEVGSCSSLELVMQNLDLAGFPRMYHSCDSYAPFIEKYSSYDFKLQNAMPAPYCLYSDPTKAGCFKYYANEWMTFQVHVKIGPRGSAPSPIESNQNPITGFINSTVEFWVAREGKPSVLVQSYAGVTLHETQGKSYGKLWLTPYQTNKDANAVNVVANTWYDELIVSRNKIPDPNTAAVPAPKAPSNVAAQ